MNYVQRAGADTCMPEHQKRRLLVGLVVSGEIKAEPMPRPEPARIGDERDSIVHDFTDRHRVELPAGKNGRAGLAPGLVDLSQVASLWAQYPSAGQACHAWSDAGPACKLGLRPRYPWPLAVECSIRARRASIGE